MTAGDEIVTGNLLDRQIPNRLARFATLDTVGLLNPHRRTERIWICAIEQGVRLSGGGQRRCRPGLHYSTPAIVKGARKLIPRLRRTGESFAGFVLERLRRPFARTLFGGLAIFDARSWSRLLTLQKFGASRTSGDDLVALGVRRWRGGAVYVRPGTTDWNVVHMALFNKFQRPPAGLTPVRTILDLGSNIGVTTADLAEQHPDAKVIGVELDASNCEVAQRNVKQWSDRASIVHGAVWTSDGEIGYRAGRGGEWAYHVMRATDDSSSVEVIDTVPAYSMSTLIEKLVPSGSVDYVKMDIEGAEEDVLGDGQSWAPRVRCIKVEVHVNLAECESQLRRLGFTTQTTATLPPTVTGFRDEQPVSPSS